MGPVDHIVRMKGGGGRPDVVVIRHYRGLGEPSKEDQWVSDRDGDRSWGEADAVCSFAPRTFGSSRGGGGVSSGWLEAGRGPSSGFPASLVLALRTGTGWFWGPRRGLTVGLMAGLTRGLRPPEEKGLDATPGPKGLEGALEAKGRSIRWAAKGFPCTPGPKGLLLPAPCCRWVPGRAAI
jgi:hypothetical protein